MKEIKLGDRMVGEGHPTFIIAEMSANHLMDYDRAIEIIRAAKDAGADAVKLQTYTPDTITIDCDKPEFQIEQGTLWDGKNLYQLYKEAYTPWEWQKDLMKEAESLGMLCFSSPFDPTAVDFMEELGMPIYKVASFEITDIPLIRKIARTGKPIIMSTGIATLSDIEFALNTCKEEGNRQVILLKCTSAYPAPYEDINLRTIPHMAQTFDCIAGLSDHTMGHAVAVGSVALGANVVEKHLTLSRKDGGADGAFSMEPQEFEEMVYGIRILEQALGKVSYELTEKQKDSCKFSRSLFAVEDIKKGEQITNVNIRSIRPGDGLHPKHYEKVLTMRAARDIERGMPLDFSMLESDK